MSKTSKPRPLSIPRDQFGAQFEAVMPRTQKHCPGCGYLPSWCVCTQDGPGQDEASKEVKTHYERHRFNREGV